MAAFDQINQIILPHPKWVEILEHCRRKYRGNYLPGESETRSAYGLIAGIQDGYILKVESILPFKKNVKDKEPYKTYIDSTMEQYAVPSNTPFARRGWITDPKELKELYDICDREKFIVFGTYHTHFEPWEHDPTRDTPTFLDAVLAQDSHLFSFIVSMVDINRPGIRAFYEGLREKETRIRIVHNSQIKFS